MLKHTSRYFLSVQSRSSYKALTFSHHISSQRLNYLGKAASISHVRAMSSRPKILLLGEIDHAKKEYEKLAEFGDLITPKASNRKDFIKECQDGELDGVLVAYRTFDSISITGFFDEELCNALPKSWKFLCHNGAGYDQIHPDACSSRNPPLLVSNVPTAVDDSTADTAIFLTLGALRNFNTSIFALRRHDWKGKPAPSLGHDPQGKTLGILGMGGIGRNMSQKASAFGMTTIYHNRHKLPADQANGAEYVSFDDLLKRSDVLSLNLPLNPKTRHIISTPQFEMMKPTAILINTARGAVVDESALVDALDRGVIAGAGLDVFEDEPKVHPGLVANDKVILLPHMGTWTVETQTKMEEWVIENMREALTHGKLKSPVPEQKDLHDRIT